MSLLGGAGKLAGARKDLLREWDHTRQTWRDANAKAFEETYLAEWDKQINMAQRSMTTLAAVIKQLRRDIE